MCLLLKYKKIEFRNQKIALIVNEVKVPVLLVLTVKMITVKLGFLL